MGFLANLRIRSGYFEACAQIERKYADWKANEPQISEPYQFMCEMFVETCRVSGRPELALPNREIVKQLACLPHPNHLHMLVTFLGVNLGSADWKSEFVLRQLQEGTYEIFKLVNLLNADGLNARFAKNNPESYARIVAATGAAPFNSVYITEFSLKFAP